MANAARTIAVQLFMAAPAYHQSGREKTIAAMACVIVGMH
jgi:hypothetical protein